MLNSPVHDEYQLGFQRFWHCHESSLAKTVPTIPHRPHPTCECQVVTVGYGQSRFITIQANPHSTVNGNGHTRLNDDPIDESVFFAGPKSLLTEFGINH